MMSLNVNVLEMIVFGKNSDNLISLMGSLYGSLNFVHCFILGELAPALSATINITGDLVDFVLVHMGNDR